MSESSRFDPLSWFLSACFIVLAGAIALHIAVTLIRSIWAWLLIGLAVTVCVGTAVRLLVWWHRRQLW